MHSSTKRGRGPGAGSRDQGPGTRGQGKAEGPTREEIQCAKRIEHRLLGQGERLIRLRAGELPNVPGMSRGVIEDMIVEELLSLRAVISAAARAYPSEAPP